MSASSGRERRPGVTFRHLEVPDEFRAVEEVQRDAGGRGSEPPVPAAILRACEDNGGLMLGAFAGDRLLGFTMGFLGREDSATFHYSHMTAVRRAEQRHRLGYELKLYQREEVLRQGLDEVRWTFDPLQCKNASLNVHRLGGRPTRYLPRYYGVMADAINAGLETDRFLLVWSLTSARVRDRLSSPPDDPDSLAVRVRAARSVLETSIRPNGVRYPSGRVAAEGPAVSIEIPADLGRVRSADPAAARAWREATREAFQEALRAGYVVDDVVRSTIEGEERCFYLLRTGEAAHAA